VLDTVRTGNSLCECIEKSYLVLRIEKLLERVAVAVMSRTLSLIELWADEYVVVRELIAVFLIPA
jgi:hypothetical protein